MNNFRISKNEVGHVLLNDKFMPAIVVAQFYGPNSEKAAEQHQEDLRAFNRWWFSQESSPVRAKHGRPEAYSIWKKSKTTH